MAEFLTVGIVTTGRNDIVAANVLHLASLKDGLNRLVICIAEDRDFDETAWHSEIDRFPFEFRVVKSEKGTCAQRNTVLREEAKAGTELLVFLDDDFLVSDDFFLATRRLFSEHPDVVLATGKILADGAHGPGYMPEDGIAVLEEAPKTSEIPEPREVHSVYGCNMALRLSALREPMEMFDEELPLYGWLEDLDFSFRARKFGRVVKAESLQGVHLGTKTGRTSGLRLGYSQIANPVYLLHKGTIARRNAARLMVRNILANLFGSASPPKWIDRRGRLRGNLVAIGDVLRRRSSPKRILGL